MWIELSKLMNSSRQSHKSQETAALGSRVAPRVRRMQDSGTQLPDAMAKRWSTAIRYAVFGLPAIMVLGAALFLSVGNFSPSGAYCGNPRLYLNRDFGGYAQESGGVLFSWAAFAFTFNWPFFVFASKVKRRMRARRNDLRPVPWAAAGALVGFSLPYILFYIWHAYWLAWRLVFCGPSFYLPLSAWFVSFWPTFLFVVVPGTGGVLAIIGWFIGLLTFKISLFLKTIT
jgi:hypothetical protein